MVFSTILTIFAATADIGTILMMFFLFFFTPVFSNLLLVIINLIARLFQCGNNKNWKNKISKMLLYLSVILQGFLVLYLTIISFTGIGLSYIFVYLILAINIYGFVKNIGELKSIKKTA